MFGFMAVFIVAMTVYLVLWKGKLAVWFSLDGVGFCEVEREGEERWAENGMDR